METAPKKRVTKAVRKTVVLKDVPRKRVAVKKVAVSEKTEHSVSKVKRSPKKVAPRLNGSTDFDGPVSLPVGRLARAKTKVSKPTIVKLQKKLDQDTVALITGTVSLRLKEKARLYRDWYDRESPGVAARVAVTFGYLFVLFGTFSLFAFSSSVPLSQTKLFATATCGGIGEPLCDSVSGFTASSANQIGILNPEVFFVSSVMVEPGKDTPLEISVRNSPEHSVLIISRQSTERRELPLEGRSGDDRYKYRIPTSTMSPGEYKILVRAKSANGSYSEFLGPYFIVPTNPPSNYTPNSISGTTSSTSSSTVTTSTVSSSTTSTVNNNTGSYSNITPSSAPVETETSDATSTVVEENATETEPVVTEEPEQEVEVTPIINPLTEAEPEQLNEMRLILSPGVFPGQFKLDVVPSYNYSVIELYARAENSTQPFFLGVASRTSKNWQYWLDTTSLPAGKYRVIARAFDEGVLKETAEIRFQNDAPKPTYQIEPAYTTTKEEVKQETVKIALSTSTPVAQLANPEVPLLPTLLTSPYRTSSTPIAREVELKKVDEILKIHSDSFNDLLRRYGSALQSGDENLQRVTEEALNDRVNDILATEVVDSDFSDSIYSLEADLRQELDGVKEQVKRVENFKKERTSAASSADTDEDGISDFDEYLLYDTDPKNPDTDADGVIDGVEIGLGYDPVDEKPEAVIRFNSPKQVSYEDNTLLTVETVAPLLVYETDEEVPAVQSEISGFGLPNSFVTLYIFSDPIVVVVKTKDDGSFSYTFSKELEDGEHEVYAALTDNKGEIVVRSSAFKFVKTAEAYVAVPGERETATVLAEGGLAAPERAYNIVAAMGIISFGLILLLLGATLRQDRTKPVVQTV